jgi:hypothetical protein
MSSSLGGVVSWIGRQLGPSEAGPPAGRETQYHSRDTTSRYDTSRKYISSSASEGQVRCLSTNPLCCTASTYALRVWTVISIAK